MVVTWWYDKVEHCPMIGTGNITCLAMEMGADLRPGVHGFRDAVVPIL
jgi:hypothetical protein